MVPSQEPFTRTSLPAACTRREALRRAVAYPPFENLVRYRTELSPGGPGAAGGMRFILMPHPYGHYCDDHRANYISH
jgi:hypothetical protein